MTPYLRCSEAPRPFTPRYIAGWVKAWGWTLVLALLTPFLLLWGLTKGAAR